MNALVTGASSGIGWEIAKRLAARGYHLILVARREARLQELADTLPYGATVLPRDLSVPGAANELFMTCQELGLEVEVLVNNAGFGTISEHLDLPPERVEEMNHLNVVTLSSLCRLFGEPMKQRGHGSILNLGSMAGYLPIPSFANYSASKAFVNTFTLALRNELAPHGVQVCLLSPGPTDSEFGAVAGDGGHMARGGALVTHSDEVAQEGVQGLFADTAEVMPGTPNKLLYWALRVAPRGLAISAAGWWRRRRSAKQS